MAQYGLSTEGFLVKTLDILREEMGAALQQAFGPSIRLDDQSVLGQLIGIVAERLALIWELAEVVNYGQDPDAATGAALEQICLLTGTLRPPATNSTVALTLTGTPGTTVTAGPKVRTVSTQQEFQITTGATIVALTPWVVNTAYVVGDRRTAEGGCFQCTIAGTSNAISSVSLVAPDFPNAMSMLPQPFTAILDGGVTWIYLGPGTGVVDTVGSAVATGPIVALANDLREIVNPSAGWDGVINLADANPGRDIATDAELRLLREQELASGGSTPANALRAELRKLADVVAVTIFVNNTDITDVAGVPPHSIEVLVRGPAIVSAAFDQTIFDALLAGVAAGIRTHSSGAGAVSGTATDDEGTVHVMKFTRPVEIPIYTTLVVIKDPAFFPSDGDTQIKLAIKAWGDLQNTGKDVVAARISAAAFGVDGVLDVTSCLIGTAPGPVAATTIPISLRELATYATTRITVTSSDGVP